MASTNGFPSTRRNIHFESLNPGDPNAPRPRLGRLSLNHRQALSTPSFFAVTSRGVVPHLTPDVISAHTQIGGAHIALEDCE